jgi:hypothetical protein
MVLPVQPLAKKIPLAGLPHLGSKALQNIVFE